VSRLEALESKLASHSLWGDSQLLPRLVALQHKDSLAAAARAAKKELKAAQVRHPAFSSVCWCTCGSSVRCIALLARPAPVLQTLVARSTTHEGGTVWQCGYDGRAEDGWRCAVLWCAVLQGLVLQEDLKARMRVLRRLGYIDSGAVWQSAQALMVLWTKLQVLSCILAGGSFALLCH
jgi:hypothetical protein